MSKDFKRVPALDKGIRILDLLAHNKKPMGLSEISKALGYHAGTVYNIAYTLIDLGILDVDQHKKFSLGRKVQELGQSAGRKPELVQQIHPYLEEINRQTLLTTVLSIRSGLQSVVIDKVESTYDIRFTPEYGRSLSILGGAIGKALLSQLPEEEIDGILSKAKLKKYTPNACVDKKKFKEMIIRVRKEGIAFSNEERTEGVCAFAIPLSKIKVTEPLAIWVVGLKTQIKRKGIPFYKRVLKREVKRIEKDLSL